MENYIATYFLVTFRAHEIECVIHLGLSLVTNRVVGIYTDDVILTPGACVVYYWFES